MILILTSTSMYYFYKKSNILLQKKMEMMFVCLTDGKVPKSTKAKETNDRHHSVVLGCELGSGTYCYFTLSRSSQGSGAVVRFWGASTESDGLTRNFFPRGGPGLFQSGRDLGHFSLLGFADIPDNFYSDEAEYERTDPWEWYSADLDNPDLFSGRPYMTPDRQAILRDQMPLILRGPIGSGRTTLAFEYFLGIRKESLPARFLCMGQKQRESTIVNDTLQTYICFFREMHNPGAFPQEKEIKQTDFCQRLLQHTRFCKKNGPLIWEQINTVIKGGMMALPLHWLRLVKPLGATLTRRLQTGLYLLLRQLLRLNLAPGIEEYLASKLNFCKGKRPRLEPFLAIPQAELGPILIEFADRLDQEHPQLHKKNSLTLEEYLTYDKEQKKKQPYLRADVYEVFLWYEQEVAVQGHWDTSDLAREVMLNLDIQKTGSGSLICDDVDQLNPAWRQMLPCMMEDPSQLVLTLDCYRDLPEEDGELPEWAAVQGRCHELKQVRSGPALRPLLEAVGTTMIRPRLLVGLKTSRAIGRLPVVASGISEESMLSFAARAAENDAILVHDEPTQNWLRARLGSERVFTLEDIQDTSFDTVLVWRMLTPQKDNIASAAWQNILTESYQPSAKLFIQDQLKLLYKAITCARHDLVIYDGPTPAPAFEIGPLKNFVFVCSDIEHLNSLWQPLTTDKEWEELGETYRKQAFWEAAEASFRNSSNTLAVLRAQVRVLEEAGQPQEAARICEIHGDWERAARNHEKSGNYQAALEIWRSLYMRHGIFRCRVAILLANGEPQAVAKLYERSGHFEQAAEYYVMASAQDQAARLYHHRLNQPEKAIHFYVEAKSFNRAARLLEKLGSLSKAVPMYLRSGEPDQAERLLKKLNDTEGLFKLYHDSDQQEKLLICLEQSRDLTGCLAILKQMPLQKLKAESEALLARRKYFRVYVRCLVTKDWERAGLVAMRMKMFREAGHAFLRAGQFFAAGDALGRAGEWMPAVAAFLETDCDEPEFKRTRRLLPKFQDNAWLREKADELMNRKAWTRAVYLFTKLQLNLELGHCLLLLGKKEEALKLWAQMTKKDQLFAAIEICMEIEELEAGMRLILDLDLCFPFWLRGLINEEEAPAFFELMDRYFKVYHDPIRKQIWINRLRDRDRKGCNAYSALKISEEIGDLQSCLEILDRWKQVPAVDKALKQRLRLDLQDRAKQLSPEGLALRHYALKSDKWQDSLNEVELTPQTGPLFLLVGNYLQVATVYLKHPSHQAQVMAIAKEHGLNKEIAEIAHKMGNLASAGQCYMEAGKLDEALACLQEVKEPILQAEVLAMMGRHEEAYQILRKLRPVPHRPLAHVLESLHRYKEAAGYYRQAGDGRDAYHALVKHKKQQKSKRKQ